MAFSEDVFVPVLTIGNSRLSVVAAELHGRLFEALWGFHRAGKPSHESRGDQQHSPESVDRPVTGP